MSFPVAGDLPGLLKQSIARAEREHSLLAVCHLDLNDPGESGHHHPDAANAVLPEEVARRLRPHLRPDDSLIPLHDGEFVVLLTGLATEAEAEIALARLSDALALPFPTRSGRHSASLGAALYPADGADAAILLRRADQAMYLARQEGHGHVHRFGTERDRLARTRRNLRGRLAHALHHSELVLHWQPRVDMRDGRVIGAEALVRWPQADGSLLHPDQFLPPFEHDDLIVAIGDWVLAGALRQLQEWNAGGLNLQVSVNIAARHLAAPDFAGRLFSLLDAHPDIRPGQLEIEVLETAALADLPQIIGLMHDCRDRGVSFALDDFGTGYSSITHFRRLPVDTVKIDQSFVASLPHDPDDQAIVKAVLGLAAAFGKQVVAEGVESVEHGTLLLHLGCRQAQGYAISPPIPAGKMAAWAHNYVPPAVWMQNASAARHHSSLQTA